MKTGFVPQFYFFKASDNHALLQYSIRSISLLTPVPLSEEPAISLNRKLNKSTSYSYW